MSNTLQLYGLHAAHPAALSMGLSQQEYPSELPFPPPGDLPDPRIEPMASAAPVLAGGFLTTQIPGKPPGNFLIIFV